MRRLALLMVLLGLAVPAPAHASFPGANGKIAFASTRDEPNPGSCQPKCNWEIYTMNPDGTGLTRLTNNPAPDATPAWSPDGQRIAFMSIRDDPNLSTCGRGGMSPPCRDQIYVMNADGSGVMRLTNTSSSTSPTDDENPAWSPDGSKIAFIRDGGLVMMNSDGTGLVELTPGFASGEEARDPAWSPDGQTIAMSYTGGTFYDHQLYLVDADGTNLRRLRLSGTFVWVPDWSPDGTQITFYEDSEGLAVINRDGTGYRRLFACTNKCPFFGPVARWSPDGSKFLLQGCVPSVTSGGCSGTEGIYTANRDESGLTRLTSNASDAGPDWQRLLGPQRGDYKNAAQFCKAEREFLGDEAFRNKYGTNGSGANAYGKCVSQNN